MRKSTKPRCASSSLPRPMILFRATWAQNMMKYASPTSGSSWAVPRRAPASIIRSRTISDSGYLTNQLLIAMPLMGDPNFAQTVALVCDHSSRGALGLILNKPLPMRMGEIFAQLEIELSTGPLRERQVLRGGPMQTDRGFVVHRAGGEWDSTLKVSEVIHVTTSRDILAAMASGQGPQEAVVALGYAGWDGGQLEDEIRANAWLNAPVDPDLIFELPFESRWQAAGRLLGVELSQISPISGNA